MITTTTTTTIIIIIIIIIIKLVDNEQSYRWLKSETLREKQKVK